MMRERPGAKARRTRCAVFAVLGAGLLSACAEITPPPDTDLEELYASREQSLLARGYLRRDTDPRDAPFSARDLVRNFERIAFFQEFTSTGLQWVKKESTAPLRRFDGPVRVTSVFGLSTPTKARRMDAREVRIFTRTLASLSGLDMKMADGGKANFHVMFLDREEQARAAATLDKRIPGVPPSVVRSFRNSPPNIYCTAYSFASPQYPAQYKSAIVLIKSEHPDLSRQSCIHEEMTQALGLSNDSRAARPSIFNDNEEFALLTRHDAALVRMLYDSRLRPGMSLEEARPLLPRIAEDALAARLF